METDDKPAISPQQITSGSVSSASIVQPEVAATDTSASVPAALHSHAELKQAMVKAVELAKQARLNHILGIRKYATPGSPLTELLDNVSDIVVMSDLVGKIVSINDAGCDFLCKPRPEIIGKDDHELFPEPIASKVAAARQKVIESKDSDRIEVELQCHNELTSLYIQIEPIYGADLNVSGTLLITRDLSAQNSLLQQREQITRRFEKLIEHCPIPIFQADKAGNCTYVNPALERFYGLPTEELLNSNLGRFIHPDDLAENRQAWSAMETEGKPYVENCRIILPNGNIRYLDGYALVLRDEDDQIESFLGCIVDVTAHVNLQKQLENWSHDLELKVEERTKALSDLNTQLNTLMTQQLQSQALLESKQQQLAHAARVSTLGQLAAGLTHELNQPLQASLNYISVIEQIASREAINPQVLALLSELSGEIHRAAKIIQNNRQFVRPVAGNPRAIQLLKVLDDTVALLKFELRSKNVFLDIVGSDGSDACTVDADEIQLQQVFINLVKNAIDAIDQTKAEERRITVTTTTSEEFTIVQISDTGPGVPDDLVCKLFTPFFTTKQNGLGLGLTISRAIIEQLGGKLCYRRSPSTFEIQLPRLRLVPTPAFKRFSSPSRSEESSAC